jgi:hypothetical protein
MPSTSKKQHNFMAAIAKNPSFAKKAGVPSSVGKEFLTADKGKTFKEGGIMKKSNPFMEMIAKKKEAAAKKPAKAAAMPMKKGGKASAPKKMMSGGMAKKKSGKAC